MDAKKLVSPAFRVTTGQYEIAGGMEVECFSSRQARADWCRISFTSAMQGTVTYDDMEPAVVELGYEDDYDVLLSGYCRKTSGDTWKELLIRDPMMKLERFSVKASFTGCTPQDIIKYVLIQAGIEHYRLSDEVYAQKNLLVIDHCSGVETIEQVNTAWGLDNDFFFRDGMFYWGCVPDQENIYVLEEDENILSLNRYGGLYEIETFGVPWIHHSQAIEVVHTNYTGTVKVEKTIIKSDESGYVRMYIYFKGG